MTIPLAEAGGYVAAAYIVFVAILLIYLAIMAGKLVRMQRSLGEIRKQLDENLDENKDKS